MSRVDLLGLGLDGWDLVADGFEVIFFRRPNPILLTGSGVLKPEESVWLDLDM